MRRRPDDLQTHRLRVGEVAIGTKSVGTVQAVVALPAVVGRAITRMNHRPQGFRQIAISSSRHDKKQCNTFGQSATTIFTFFM